MDVGLADVDGSALIEWDRRDERASVAPLRNELSVVDGCERIRLRACHCLGLAGCERGDEVLLVGAFKCWSVERFDLPGGFADDVQVVAESATTHRDVTHFAVEVVGPEHERPINRQALRLVDRHRVAVGDMSGVQVRRRQRDNSVDHLHGDRSFAFVDCKQSAALAVTDIESSVVAQRHDAVAGLERRVIDEQRWPREAVRKCRSGELVECTHIVAPGGEHDRFLACAASGRPFVDEARMNVNECCDT